MDGPHAQDDPYRLRPVLVAGLPRSGTTWVGEILRSAEGVEYLFEPDNEKTSPMGWHAKRDLHRFPYLRAGDAAVHYEEFWRAVLFGAVDRWHLHSLLRVLWRTRVSTVERMLGAATGVCYAADGTRIASAPRGPTHAAIANSLWSRLARASYDPDGRRRNRRVVKSVHCTFALEWLAARFDMRLVLVLRNPYALFASYRRMRMPDRVRNVLAQPRLRAELSRYLPDGHAPHSEDDEIAFQIALAYAIIAAQAQAHPEWTLLSHDRLCVEPAECFAKLFRALDMTWGPLPAARLTLLDGEGSGYEAQRRASEQPAKWRGELSTDQRDLVERWMTAFGLADFARECITV